MSKNTGHSFYDYTAATDKQFKQIMQQKTEADMRKMDDELFKTKPGNWIVKDYCERLCGVKTMILQLNASLC